MVDFAKITKTLDGYPCHYFGTRMSFGTNVHCFGVMTVNGVMEKCFDSSGRQLFFNTTLREWDTSKSNAFQIVKPPKIVEVTKWIGLFADDNGDYHLTTSGSDAFLHHSVIAKQQHTFRFEVPHE